MPNQPPNRRPTATLASRPAVESLFRQLQPHFFLGKWLSSNNRYAVDTISRLDSDLSSTPSALVHTDLAQYIAASAPLHLMDGWAFLGRAADATLRGDSGAARHLAYYAELRAAMALLATEGLAVFNKRHFGIDQSATPFPIPAPSPTHQMVWQLLEAWSQLPKAATLVGDVIEVGGVTLNTWLQHFAAASSSALQPVAIDWLKTWGLDLQQLSLDRDARNESSYRPTGLNASKGVKSRSCIQAVTGLWRAFEPAALARFEVIDSYLMRVCVEQIFSARVGQMSRTAARAQYRVEISSMIGNVNPANDQASLRSFLLRKIERRDVITLSLAKKTDLPSASDHHLQVLSRAALLLRIASGACALLFKQSNTSLSRIRFWWSGLGVARGCWEKKGAPSDVTDLWADVEEALTGIDRAQQHLTSKASMRKWRQKAPGEIATLGECERIGLWGINV